MTQTKRDVRQNAIRLSGDFRKLVTSIKVSHLPVLNSFAIISNCLISWCSVLTGKDPIQVQGVNTEEVVFVCIFFFQTRLPVLSCAYYFQVPATQANCRFALNCHEMCQKVWRTL